MSGIAGIVQLDGGTPPVGWLQKMTTRMRHRGPDGVNHWQQGEAAVGHCLLCTTAESLEEQQPLLNDDGTLVLVADLRLGNWRELRSQLLSQGMQLRTRSDAELVLRAFERWGEGCLAHIEGDYAFAIWQVRERRLFCARDRMGNKSLFWNLTDERFVFATDMAALLALPGAWQVNDLVLAELVTSNLQIGNQTLWQGVESLPFAHYGSLKDGQFSVQRYWSPDLEARLHCRTDEEYVACYRDMFLREVERQCRSHKPLAFEVSGGLDSSAVFAAALHLNKQGHLPAPGLQAWTLDCSDDADASELAWVRDLSDFAGCSIHEIPAFVPERKWFEEASANQRSFPPYPHAASMETIQNRIAEAGSRVVMNGHGGDEWLWGSRLYYAEALQALDPHSLCQCLKADARDYGKRIALFWLLRHGLFRTLPFAIQTRLLATVRRLRGQAATANRHKPWLNPLLLRSLGPTAQTSPKSLPRAGQESIVEQLADPIVHWLRQASDRDYARHGLEPRSPMYSAEFVQFACSLPERMLMRGDSYKFIHVQAMAGLLPASILERRSKAEFSYLFRRQFVGLQQFFLQDLLVRRRDWVLADPLAKLVQEALQSGDSSWPQWWLWNLFAADTFLRCNADDSRILS